MAKKVIAGPNRGKQNEVAAGKLEDTAPAGKKGPKNQDVKSKNGKRG
jgi:hypothetical protein